MKDNSIATFIPERVLTVIKSFSKNYDEAEQTVKTIHNAKRKAEQVTNIPFIFEELDQYGVYAEANLYSTLLKAYRRQKTEKIENLQNLIFTYVKNWFVEYACAAIRSHSETDLPKVSLYDWSKKE
jgi:hypothetical protein